jgi:hypothetical protein
MQTACGRKNNLKKRRKTPKNLKRRTINPEPCATFIHK